MCFAVCQGNRNNNEVWDEKSCSLKEKGNLRCRQQQAVNEWQNKNDGKKGSNFAAFVEDSNAKILCDQVLDVD